MRILYGVQTTGHGHLVRSTPIIHGLRAAGHQVEVLLSGPPPDPAWITRVGAPLTQRPGLTFSAEGGRIRYVQTMTQARPLAFLRDVFRKAGDHDLVVTDYEPITAWQAKRAGLRSIGIGHLYAFAHASVPRARGNLITHAVMDLFAPVAVPAGTHWAPFEAPLLPPSIDPAVLSLARGDIDQGLFVVYLGFEPLGKVIPLLRQFPQARFHLYARVSNESNEANVNVRPISRPRFLADLAVCRGVIANAGFTLTSECLQLGIAVLVKPLTDQLEQESNAVALERLGLGSVSTRLARADIAAWLDTPPPAPQRYPDVTAALTDWLAAGATEPLERLSARLWSKVGASA
jgi:uncharacterized protein (TIGR00661 family)